MKKSMSATLSFFVFGAIVAQTPTTVVKEGSYTVTGSVSLTATQSITLKPDTWIQNGATFTATVLSPSEIPYQPITYSDENYVFTRTFQKEISSFSAGSAKEQDVLESIAYFDGLGRPIQQIAIKASPERTDILTPVEYDGHGRQAREHLPYLASGTLAHIRTDALTAVDSYYVSNYPDDINSGSPNPFSEKEFEASPLNRVLKQAAPGHDWRLGGGHEITFGHDTNGGSEVRRYNVGLSYANKTYTPTLVADGHYGAGELYKNTVFDENHGSGTDHTTEEFTDKQGRVVLKRTYNSGAHDTYYVYDDFGNLTYVLPPKVVHDSNISTTELNELCYQYKYDDRDRLVEKKIPGKEWESIVYNELDLPIMTQDGLLDAQNKWLFTVYDPFGRVAYTGMDTDNGNSRSTVQTAADGAGNQYVTKTTSPTSYAGTPVYYTKNAYPTSFDQVHTINYYDDYTFDLDGGSSPGTVYGETVASNAKGLPTGSKARVLGTSDWITTVTYYDSKGRAIYVYSKNGYLNTVDIVQTKLDFAGKVLETTTSHTKDGGTAIVTVDSFIYDHMGRLLVQDQTIGGQAMEIIVQNGYDDLGQLVRKKVGNTASSPLQTVDYTYNVRGWLKAINSTASLGSDLFAFDINYNTADHSGTELYNGNIAETEWRTANDNTLRWYRYGYDALNRIENAMGSSSNHDLTNVDYDKNGNITALARNGHTNSGATSFGAMDNLTYGYQISSNKLTNVADAGASDAYGFVDVNGSGTEYTYDANGNMTSDANKGITSISYNHMNLPTKITLSGSVNNGVIDYIYDATGARLQKTVTPNGQSSVTTEYANGYIYENGNLRQFLHPEGYVEPDENGGYDYVYSYLDHLGTVRLTYSDFNGNGSIEPGSEIVMERNTYPFGLEHKGYNNIINGTENNYFTYQGKELDKSLGLNWLDFELRNYDTATARWFNLDPKADAVDLVSSSPYSFALNNPITYRDPEGDCPPGVICIPVIYDAAIRLASNVSDKIDRANHIASGMVETFDDADKRTGGDGISGYRKATIFASRYINEFGEYFSINDVSVLKEGKNLNGTEASTADFGFAAAAVILPISGSKLKGLAGEGLDALTQVFNKTSNQAKHLDAKHINAAVGDILGNPITINGKTYDHLDEVQNALNGVGNQLGNLNKQIEAGTFTGEVLEAAETLRSSLQKQKDEITDILNRAYNKANE